jgi:DNA-binding NarL/FixJ family response regulator
MDEWRRPGLGLVRAMASEGGGLAMKFLVADDHPLVRRAIGLTLDRVAPGAVVVEADSLPQALEELARHADLDLVVLDLFMPGSQGLEALRAVRAVSSAVVAVISADEDPRTAVDALTLGAAGFLPKSLSEDVLRAAIALILAGGIYVPPQVAQAPQARDGAEAAARRGGEAAMARSGTDSLTPRQREVLELVIEGLSNREIAERLTLAEATVKVHITAILRAYGVNSRAKAIGAARRGAEAGPK